MGSNWISYTKLFCWENNKKMTKSIHYSKQVLENANFTILENIMDLSRNKNKKLFYSVYAIETYFRPIWFQKIENGLYRLNLLKNPTLGLFQIKINKLGGDVNNLSKNSYKYLNKEFEKYFSAGRNKKQFIKFGLSYNNTRSYGEVMYEIYTRL